MRRTIPTATLAAALVALAGCFEPVAPVHPAADAGSAPACLLDTDCPQPLESPCTPKHSVCREGFCTVERLPVVWEDRPGACEEAADCDCQSLGRDPCEGGFDCVAGTCTWSCEQPPCSLDRDCPIGAVCEPIGDCSTERACVAGCHENEECPAGQLCTQPDCFTCPCPGGCVAAPECRTDGDCPSGTVCEPTPERPAPHCIPGCRDDGGCAQTEACVYGACPECPNCPCIGQCEPREECASDEQCPRGSACAQDFDCRRKCLPGACHDGGDCTAGEQCAPPPPCASCGCDHGTCVPGPETCRVDTDCSQGSVCGWDDACERACVPGCRSDSECREGEFCGPELCNACSCQTPRCQPRQGCSSDRECDWGLVCEPTSPDCAGERQCVPGCHGEEHCGPDEICLQPDCATCPCPGFCERVMPPACASDRECGPGMVCEGCDPSGGDAVCIPGCRLDTGCADGSACTPVDCDTCPCPPGLCLQQPQGCTNDQQCPFGTVCEQGEGCTEPSLCVPGCHEDWQCRAGERCLMVPCFTCPCPGYCEPAAECTDADGDGFVVDCHWGICAGARGYCDCEDQDPTVFPGAPERCGDGRDDNCDGQVDEGCGCPNGSSCGDTLDCALGSSYCENGCCASCMPAPQLPCGQGECAFATGIDMQGCPLPSDCGACCTCPEVLNPVCSTSYQTYGNPCEARCAGAVVLHAGECLPGEGLGCGWADAAVETCPPGQYCRDACPMCDMMLTRCTRVGACEWDWDCPAGLTPPPCSAGPGRWSCADHACVFSCP